MKRTYLDLQLKKLIKKYHTIIIAKHTYPDWDAQGSAIGLANIINDNFTKKDIYVVGDRLDDDTTFSPELLTSEMIKSALLITVDTANVDRLDFPYFSNCQEIFKIDHHVVVDQFGANNMVDDQAIACAQMVALWAKRMRLRVSKSAAMNLYKGILTDSGRFLFAQTSANTFEAASFLMKSGINLTKIQEELYLMDLKVKEWQNEAFSQLIISRKGVGYILCKEEDYKKYDLSYGQIKSALSTMAGIRQIPIWFTVIEIDGMLKVSIRSREYEIREVAAKYRGGGHRLASGAKLESLDEIPKLIKDLENLITPE